MSSFAGASDAANGPLRPMRGSDRSALTVRWFGWTMLAVMAAFVLNNYLTYWHDLPGIAPIFDSCGMAGGEFPENEITP